MWMRLCVLCRRPLKETAQRLRAGQRQSPTKTMQLQASSRRRSCAEAICGSMAGSVPVGRKIQSWRVAIDTK